MVALRRMRLYFEFLGFRLVAFAMSAMPLDFASAFSGWSWRKIAPRLRRHARAREAIALAFPEKSAGEHEAIAVAMWENLGRVFAEFFHMPRIYSEQRLALEGPEKFQAIVDAGSCIVCCLHMGNWELGSSIGNRFGVRLGAVYQELTNPLVDRYIHAIRAPFYVGGLFGKSPKTAKILLKHVRSGGSVAILADLRERRGVQAPFFDRPAGSTAFPAFLARAENVPIYAARVKRLKGAHFSMRIERVEMPLTENREADVEQATKNVQAWFETYVREAPEQWMWSHRRWD